MYSHQMPNTWNNSKIRNLFKIWNLLKFDDNIKGDAVLWIAQTVFTLKCLEILRQTNE